MSKKEKQKYVDDGQTIYDMNVDAEWNNQQKNNKNTIYVSKEEERAIINSILQVRKLSSDRPGLFDVKGGPQ